MPPTAEDRLRDIFEAITEIEDVTQALTFDRFASDRRVRFLTERLSEIVCEASRTLPDEIKRDEPGIDWRKMIDFGNCGTPTIPPRPKSFGTSSGIICHF